MSSSKPFSREELATLSRWEFPPVGEEDEREPDEPIPEPEPEEIIEPPYIPTAEEIEAMQKQAYDEAYAQGFGEGSERGYQEGRERGFTEGQQQGQKEGYEAGYAEGQAQGLEAGRIEMEQARDRFGQLIDCLDEPLTHMDEQVEEEIIALVIALARQLIRRELRAQPGEIVGLVRQTLGLLPASSRRVTLHLHPDDAERVRSSLHLDENLPRWKIAESPELTPGGCQVTTENSFIDATVEKRLAMAITQLMGGEREEDEAA